jgi:hypothetical protein
MRNVYIKKTIRIRLTANDWSLYGDDDDAARDMAAFEMNEKIEAVLNAQPTELQAARAIADILKAYSSFGADDSEGHDVAGDLMEVFYQGESK